MTHINLPINFTEKMKEANPVHNVLYVHGITLACISEKQDGRIFLCTKETAKIFNVLESDVIAAFQYWQLNRLVHLIFDEKLIIDFIGFSSQSQYSQSKPSLHMVKEFEPKKEHIITTKDDLNAYNVDDCVDEEIYSEEIYSFDINEKVEYTPEELEIYQKGSPAVASLFKKTEELMGSFLKSSDLSTVFSFYEWLELPLEVIEIILDYCKQNKQKNMNYIEQIAMDWSDQNIKTVTAAKEYIDKINKNYRSVLRAIGQSGQDNVTASQKKYIDKWLDKYNLDLELVLAACDRTVMTTGKPTFAYIDKILTTWYKNGVNSIEQVEELDKKHEQNQKVMKTAKRKPSKFNNFNPTPMDHDKLESMSFELIKNASMGI